MLATLNIHVSTSICKRTSEPLLSMRKVHVVGSLSRAMVVESASGRLRQRPMSAGSETDILCDIKHYCRVDAVLHIVFQLHTPGKIQNRSQQGEGASFLVYWWLWSLMCFWVEQQSPDSPFNYYLWRFDLGLLDIRAGLGMKSSSTEI